MSQGIEAMETDLLLQITPVLLALADTGRVAVALGGSRAKGLADSKSDYDFRVYADRFRGPELTQTTAWVEFEAIWRAWESRGLRIDGAWCRGIADIDRDLVAWRDGIAEPPDYDWTIWGYHLPTDIAHQQIIADPDGVLAGWKASLAVYPEPLRRAVVAKHLSILRYWRNDYHYLSKVDRGDAMFLAGLTAKLLHSVAQVLFALNRTYFVGDGWNLRTAAAFTVLPANLAPRVEAILDPGARADRWQLQYRGLVALIDDLDVLVASQLTASPPLQPRAA